MAHIKEPKGVDLVVTPMPFSEEDREAISAIITHYKRTGEMPKPKRKAETASRKIAAKKKANPHTQH